MKKEKTAERPASEEKEKKSSQKELKETETSPRFTLRDGVTLMLIPTKGDIKQFFISKAVARGIIGLAIVIAVVTAVAVATYARIAVTASQVPMLQRENKQLRQEVATIDSIRAELLALRKFRKQVLHMMGADSSTIERLREMSYYDLVHFEADSERPSSGRGGANVTQLNTTAESKEQQAGVPHGLPVKASLYRFSLSFGGRHTGVDIATNYNTPVIATADGIVEAAGYDTLYGNHVLLRHANGYETLYAHMSSIRVSKGDKVRRGQILGFVGMTGHTTGPHVHYEVRKNGVPINPEPFIKNGGA